MTRLETIRRGLGLSPEKLAGLAGISGITIRRIEAGGPTSTATLRKLADTLEVERPWDLIEQVEVESCG